MRHFSGLTLQTETKTKPWTNKINTVEQISRCLWNQVYGCRHKHRLQSENNM